MPSFDANAARCPACKATGNAIAVAIKDARRTVTYQCGACAQTWTVTDPYPSLPQISSIGTPGTPLEG